MVNVHRFACVFPLLFIFSSAFAQQALSSNGTLVIVPAIGIVTRANDEAQAMFLTEEQDKEKSAAASRVNQKMNQGIKILKKEDPQARFKTSGYYTYPVYGDELRRPGSGTRAPVAWRVGQSLEVKTTALETLPKAVAAVQIVLALNSLEFGLSEQAAKELDELRIATAYTKLTERIAAIIKAMDKNASDAVLDTVDFEGSGAYVEQDAFAPKAMMRAAATQEAGPVAEPNFEPGDTTVQTRVVGKVRIR